MVTKVGNAANTHGDYRATIFLLEEDDQTRCPLLENLRHQGYRVIVAIDEQSAKDITSFAQERPDLLLVNVVGKSLDEGLQIGRAIRDVGSTTRFHWL